MSHLLGTFLTWRITSLINAAISVVGFVLLLFAPESPSWLAKKGWLEKAERKFLWCRGNSVKARDEVAALLQRQIDEGGKGGLKELLKGRFLKPLAIIVVFLVSTQLTGVNAIAFYCVAIMQETIGGGLNEYTAMLVVDSVRVVASLIGCILLRTIGRRPLALISGTGCTISLISLAASSKVLPSFSIVFLMSYVSFVTIGLTPLPWTMVGELFPLSVRGYGSGIASSTAFLSLFAVVKFCPFMFDTIGSSATFLVYGTIALGETIFLFLVLPETRNKTLQEVEDMFRKKMRNGEVEEAKEKMLAV